MPQKKSIHKMSSTAWLLWRLKSALEFFFQKTLLFRFWGEKMRFFFKKWTFFRNILTHCAMMSRMKIMGRRCNFIGSDVAQTLGSLHLKYAKIECFISSLIKDSCQEYINTHHIFFSFIYEYRWSAHEKKTWKLKIGNQASKKNFTVL